MTQVAIEKPVVRVKRRWPLIIAVVALVLFAAVGICELAGWPFLAAPLAKLLSDKLDRRVSFFAPDNTAAGAEGFRVRFLGGISVHTPFLEIAAPTWSQTPHLLRARDVSLELRYIDLWKTREDQPLRIDLLQAAELDSELERLADGRASWKFKQQVEPDPNPPRPLTIPVFGRLQVDKGTLHYRDVPLKIDVNAQLSFVDGSTAILTSPAPSTKSAGSAPANGAPGNTLRLNAAGSYHSQPLKMELVSSGLMPWAAEGAAAVPVPLTLDATIGTAVLAFKGTAADALHLSQLSGRFTLKGPSLAAVGGPIGVTLPTTPAFHSKGLVVRQGKTWNVVIDEAIIGVSHLKGALTYETDRAVPLLAGKLGGPRLLLADLGPAVGMTPTSTKTGTGRVLPDRPFDLPSLRVMDANILLDFDELDLGSDLLEPLRPMHAHLKLADGILTLSDLAARTGAGEFTGDLSLDGRKSVAIWNANLRWKDLQLERWIHQKRSGNAPPFISGRLNGTTALQGQGRSTAQILGTLKGKFSTELRDGAMSHLLIEAAGIDIAQGLGLLIKGDKALPVTCGIADLTATDGVFRPRVMVIDTPDSTFWIDGTLSLATEAIDLRAVVSPRDFSPLALRTPLHVHGTLAKPDVSIERGPLVKKLATAALLALANPLAALLPLIDRGDTDAAKKDAIGCSELVQRGNVRRAAAAR